MRRKLDNRGSAMIIVILVIAFVSILVSTLFMMSLMNIQMKSVDRESKENFYSAEGALEQIRLGLQKEMSVYSTNAYALVMQQYANNTLEVQRRQIFNDKLLGDLKTRLENGGTLGTYDLDILEEYLTDEVEAHTVLASDTLQLESDSGSLVLKGLEVTYTDDQGYQSIIETDIRLSAPNLNLVQPADMPDVFDYSIIANEQLDGNYSGTVSIEAGVYAGNGGMNLTNGAVWNFKQANRIVVSGDVNVPDEATLTTTSDMDLWAKELIVSGGTLTSRGRTYVSNDLVMSDEGSTVTLEGEYYGYGNGQELTDAGLMLSAGGDSSAILINGVDTTLDMSNMRRLLLSGSAQIATGALTFDESLIEELLPENEPSLDTRKVTAVLSSASYYMTSLGNGKIVTSADNYLVAQTETNTNITTGSLECLLLINNDDGTFSLMDVNNETHKYKYVSVLTDDQNRLVPAADTVGINEKFMLYVITEGNANYYALKSYANGKFVSIDTYYPAEGDAAEAVLCANRDKITDDAQLFLMNRIGALTSTSEVVIEPTISISYDSADQATVRFGHASWLNHENAPVPDGHGSFLAYNVYREGTLIKTQDSEHMQFFTSNEQTKWSLYETITGLQDGDEIEYTISYVGGYGAGSKTGTYVHQAGYGNNPEAELKFVDGVYAIRQYGEKVYCQVTNYGNEIMKFCVGDAVTNATSWEMFHLVNNHDGTISLKAQVNNKYVAVQEDGALIANSDAIDINAKFIVQYVEIADAGYYQLWSVEESDEGLVKKNCFAMDYDIDGKPVYMMEADAIGEGEDRIVLEWVRATDQMGTQPKPEVVEPPVNYNPVTSVEYKDEDSALVSFTSPYWTATSAGEVTLLYTLNISPLYPEIAMDVVGTAATCTIPDLQDNDKVTYRFRYTYKDAAGVTQTVTTSNYVYVHETIYGEAVNIDSENVDINLGESIEVKSNQIAYLVPPECIGVYDGESIYDKNPMSAAEFTQLMAYANDTDRYPGFEIVSFTKEVEGLGKSLDTYRTAGTDGYRTIFVQSTEGTMVYFYVDFDSDNTSAYFRDYYEKNQDTLETYMRNYVNEIRLSNRFTRLTTDGNMVYSPTGTTGRIDLRTNEGYGAYLDEVAKNGLVNEETGYQKRFKALSAKLMLDYDDLTMAEKTRCLFDNLIRYSTDAGDADGQAFAGMALNTSVTYTQDGATALVIHNAGGNAYRYNYTNDPDKQICLIIATGDVVVEQDFAGVIIARGTVTITNSSVNTIKGNQQALYKVLKYQMDPSNPDSDTLLERFFRDGDRYVLDDGSNTVVTEGDYATYSDLITYEEWSKK